MTVLIMGMTMNDANVVKDALVTDMYSDLHQKFLIKCKRLLPRNLARNAQFLQPLFACLKLQNCLHRIQCLSLLRKNGKMAQQQMCALRFVSK